HPRVGHRQRQAAAGGGRAQGAGHVGVGEPRGWRLARADQLVRWHAEAGGRAHAGGAYRHVGTRLPPEPQLGACVAEPRRALRHGWVHRRPSVCVGCQLGRPRALARHPKVCHLRCAVEPLGSARVQRREEPLHHDPAV
ncbi:hypothetical protein EV174_002768, partial [Coemansia sp. RSA 2320]